MKHLQYHGITRHTDVTVQILSIWLHDETGAWALRIQVAKEDGAELFLLNNDDHPSVFDALGITVLPLLFQLLQATRTQTKQVELRALPQFPGAWYGVVTLENDERTFELSARKGLLIALALRCQCPLLITDELLEEKGIRLPAGISLAAWLADEPQANVYQPVVPREIPARSSILRDGLRQNPLQPLTDEQKQRVREELQGKTSVQEREKLKQLWKASPEFRQRSKEVWDKLGFDIPPVLEGWLDEEDEEPR